MLWYDMLWYAMLRAAVKYNKAQCGDSNATAWHDNVASCRNFQFFSRMWHNGVT